MSDERCYEFLICFERPWSISCALEARFAWIVASNKALRAGLSLLRLTLPNNKLEANLGKPRESNSFAVSNSSRNDHFSAFSRLSINFSSAFVFSRTSSTFSCSVDISATRNARCE